MPMEINSMEELNAMLGSTPPPTPETATIVQSYNPDATAPVSPPAPEPTEAIPEPADQPSLDKLATRDMILRNVQVDLNNVKIVKVQNPLGVFQELDTLFLKPSYDIIALQSGYRAAFKALNNDDMIKVRKFTGTEKEQNMKLFNFVYSAMVNSNLGKIRFEDWLKITAEEDFETFIYGIYCATFPKESDYDVTCPKCGTENKARISKELLIQAKNAEETGAYIQEILSKNYSPAELVNHSVVNMKDRKMLPSSKIIVDIVTPTLHDYLKSLQRSESFKGYEPEIFNYLKNVGSILIPHIHAIAQGQIEYIELESVEDKLRAIVEMPPEDRKALDQAIREKREKFKVEYKLPDCNCRSCGTEIKNIVVDMTEILFLNMVRA